MRAVTSAVTRQAAADSALRQKARTYQVRTYGCQMNVHDSERLAGLLEAAGYQRAADGADADVVVFNTCAVRENADNKLYGNLSHLAPRKQADPNMQIAVGGCLAQKDRAAVLHRAPWVDVVFGTHNIGSLPTLLDRARHNNAAQVEIVEALQEFPSALPAARESAYAAWVSISVGCNNTCTFCIVPALRGKEVDRRPGDVLAEVQSLVDQGVLEITLLGQNVNAYGVSFATDERLREDPTTWDERLREHPTTWDERLREDPTTWDERLREDPTTWDERLREDPTTWAAQPRDRGAFAKLLRACGRIEGLERVRFTSPHPAEFTDDVIDAMATTPNVCPTLHMPLQSGSDRILRAMRRSYRAERYLGIIDKVRAAIPDAAITTDLIVGFPGETEEDFQATLDVVALARFSSAFTFQYSKRPGTPAAELAGQVPKDVVAERYQRLIALQEKVSLDENTALVGRTVELLVATGEGRKDASTARMSGRARDGRLVHFNPHGQPDIGPGDIVTTTVTGAAPHHLLADGEVLSHRRTRAGEVHAAGQRPAGAAEPATSSLSVGLGMPGIGAPAEAPSSTGCAR
ncbi:MiaB/RimO family radical SAM methylthiotransferase [Mycobacterium sp. URHB0021]